MNEPVQSPAREMVSRKPERPGAGTLAKECHSLSGLRLIAVEEAGEGRLAVVEAGQCHVRRGAFGADVHLAQPQPGQGHAERDDREDRERDRALAGEQGVGPEEREGAPAAEAVDLLEVVVTAGAEGRQGGGDDEREERQEGPADGHEGAVRCRDRQRQEPGRSRQRPAHVQSAEVVHLAERPADLQRPVRRGRGRQPEKEVDDVLLAYDDGEGEVGERGVPEGGGGQGPGGPQERRVGQQHQGRQAVVVHQAGVLEQTAGCGEERRELARVLVGAGRGRGHRATARRSSIMRSSACLSTLPRSVPGRSASGRTCSGTQ